MPFDYSSIENVALNQIADKGRIVSILYKTEGTYDPTSDTLYSDSIKSVSMPAVITVFDKRDALGDLVETGDLQAIIAAQNIEKPKTNDILSDDGEEYRIIFVSEIKPGNTAILYKLQIRKG